MPYPRINWKNYNPETGVGDPSTPLAQTLLNAQEDFVEEQANLAAAAAVLAQQAAADATAPTDATVAALFGVASATRDAADARYASKALFNVRDYGAKGDGSTDDRAAIQAALDSAKAAGRGLVFIPAGVYNVSGALSIDGPGITVTGAGRSTTMVRSTSATADVFTITNLSRGASLGNMALDRTVTPSAGAGVAVAITSGVDIVTLHDLDINYQYRGIYLGPTNYGMVRSCLVGGSVSDGIYMAGSATNGQAQWQLVDILSVNNNGNGVSVKSTAGPAFMTLGNWTKVSTYGNSLSGARVVGLSSCPINGLRIDTCFFGQDGASEIFLDSYGGYHVINGVFCELAGSSTTGRDQATAPSGVGFGLEVSLHNTEVTVTGGSFRGNSDGGISTGATAALISGAWVVFNGQNAAAGISSNSGIFVSDGDTTITGCQIRGQQYGIWTVPDSVTVVGNRLQATTPIGNSATLTTSVVANNRDVA